MKTIYGEGLYLHLFQYRPIGMPQTETAPCDDRDFRKVLADIFVPQDEYINEVQIVESSTWANGCALCIFFPKNLHWLGDKLVNRPEFKK